MARKKFTEKQRAKALKMIERHAHEEKSVNALLNRVAKEIGCTPLTVRNWAAKAGYSLKAKDGAVAIALPVEERLEEQHLIGQFTSSSVNTVNEEAVLHPAEENRKKTGRVTSAQLNEAIERLNRTTQLVVEQARMHKDLVARTRALHKERDLLYRVLIMLAERISMEPRSEVDAVTKTLSADA